MTSEPLAARPRQLVGEAEDAGLNRPEMIAELEEMGASDRKSDGKVECPFG